MGIIEFKNISLKSTDGDGARRLILNDISFSVEKGEIFTIIGPSGAGKSSILRLMNRLDEPSSGKAYFDGSLLAEYNPRDLRRRISLVFQQPELFGPLVKDDLLYPETISCGKDGDEANAPDVIKLLARTGLKDEFLDREVSRLSGGEVARVAIARALVTNPDVLMLDEPTSGLDPGAASNLLDAIRSLREESGITMVIVTHMLAYARLVGDRTLLIESGSVMECCPTSEFFSNPHTEEGRKFLRSETSQD